MSINEKNITRGGEFIIKETNCENVFSPEDFSEEQLMMKQAVSDFIDKEVMPHRERFENKDYKLSDTLLMLESLPARETRNYIKLVLTNLWIYKIRFNQENDILNALASGKSINFKVFFKNKMGS